MISSPANARVTRVRRLRKARERARRGALLVEGRRAVRAALDAGRLVELYVTPAVLRRDPALAADAGRAGAEPVEVTPEVMATLTAAAVAPGALGVARFPAVAEPDTDPVLIMLGVRDPSTAGAMLATVAAIGGGAVAAGHCTDLYAPRVLRAAGGAHYRCRHRVHDGAPDDIIASQRARGARLVALRRDGPAPWSVDLAGPVALLTGTEPDDDALLDAADVQVGIPAAHGVAPGLALRAAVVLYEWVRQQGERK